MGEAKEGSQLMIIKFANQYVNSHRINRIWIRDISHVLIEFGPGTGLFEKYESELEANNRVNELLLALKDS